jgi:predicted metalloprotease with PDZ domain
VNRYVRPMPLRAKEKKMTSTRCSRPSPLPRAQRARRAAALAAALGAALALAAPAIVLAAEDRADAELESKLESARTRLEQAAREVADLSARMGGAAVDRLMFIGRDGPPRAVIGVQLDPDSGRDGARVREVSPGGPAAEAGLRAGDVIVAIDGAEVKGSERSAREVVKRMREVKPDDTVKLRVLRDGKPRDFSLKARPSVVAFFDGPAMPPPPPGLDVPDRGSRIMMIRHEVSDMELATVTPKLGRYFGTDRGVLVVRAPADGELKLEDGDVILSIDGREPTSGSHATRILRSYQPGEKVKLRVMRQRRALDLETVVPEPRVDQRIERRVLRTPPVPSVPPAVEPGAAAPPGVGAPPAPPGAPPL